MQHNHFHTFITDFFSEFAQNLRHPCVLATNDPEDAKIVYVNQRFEERTGHCLSEIIGLNFCKMIDPSSSDHFLTGLRQCALTGDVWKEKIGLTTKTNGAVEVSTSLFVINIAKENFLGALFELGENEQDSMRMFESSVEKSHALLVHDIKNNLQMIYGFSEILKPIIASNSEALEEIEKVIFQSRLAQENIGRLSNIQEFIGRCEKDNREVLDLKLMVEDCLSSIYLPPRVRLCPDLAEGLRVSFASRNMFSLLHNLIINAYQANSDEIQLRCFREDSWAIIQVKDNGKGIPKENIEKVFDKSFTTKTYGTGYGLYTVKNMIEQAHGSIEVKSKSGQGSLFKVKLPLAASS